MENTNCIAYIDNITYQRDFVRDNTFLLQLKMQYFQTNIPASRSAERNINMVVEKQVNEYYNRVSTALLKEAYDGYLYATENDFPFNPYEALLIYNITYNENCTLSFYKDDYRYTGGAHGITERSSLTFDLCSGRILPLSYFFNRNEDYRKMIIEYIITRAEQNPDIYFENFRQLIKENFNENSFYLSEDGIVFYFQQYQIAPYSSGIPEFTLPYLQVSRPPACR